MARPLCSSVDSFVVRIYRRAVAEGAEDPEGLAGTVQDDRDGPACAFHGLTELWQLLSAGGEPPRDRGRLRSGQFP